MDVMKTMDHVPIRSELESTARQWISLWSAPVDWDLFARLHADDFEALSPSGRAASKQAFAAGLAELVDAFPDLQTEVDELVIDEKTGYVAVRWHSWGTNRTLFLGLGPTNRKTLITGIEIIAIRDKRIVRRWGEWDISAHTHAADPA